MKLSPSFIALTSGLLCLMSETAARVYSRTEDLDGQDFLDKFEVQSIPDPTHGRVNYVTADVAKSKNLTFAVPGTFILRADDHTVLTPNGPGRDSVRMRTKKQYNTHVAVFHVRHMPTGCGTWPAVWETDEASWPLKGEIDILEGVNDMGPNHVTLHTSAGCTMAPDGRNQTGVAITQNCDVAVNGNAGCGVKVADEESYGPALNKAGEVWYVMERTEKAFRTWFFSRKNVPDVIRNGASSIDTSTLGVPSAEFTSATCNIAEKFGAHNIIINLTLCGEWAGAPDVYSKAGCPGSCIDHVNKNPSAFSEAFFNFGGLRIYENGPGGPISETPVSSKSTSPSATVSSAPVSSQATNVPSGSPVSQAPASSQASDIAITSILPEISQPVLVALPVVSKKITKRPKGQCYPTRPAQSASASVSVVAPSSIAASSAVASASNPATSVSASNPATSVSASNPATSVSATPAVTGNSISAPVASVSSIIDGSSMEAQTTASSPAGYKRQHQRLGGAHHLVF